MDSMRIDFIQSGLADVQSTIRAIDAKVGVILVLVLAPFAGISRIFAHVDRFCCRSPKIFFIATAICFFVFWFLALVSLVRSVGAFDNPGKHIDKSESKNGTYYGGGLYSFNVVDVFFNRSNVKANKDFEKFSNDLPTTQEEIESEILFEHMKTIYIRDLKATRLKWGLRFAALWLFLGTTIFLFSRYSIWL